MSYASFKASYSCISCDETSLGTSAIKSSNPAASSAVAVPKDARKLVLIVAISASDISVERVVAVMPLSAKKAKPLESNLASIKAWMSDKSTIPSSLASVTPELPIDPLTTKSLGSDAAL